MCVCVCVCVCACVSENDRKIEREREREREREILRTALDIVPQLCCAIVHIKEREGARERLSRFGEAVMEKEPSSRMRLAFSRFPIAREPFLAEQLVLRIIFPFFFFFSFIACDFNPPLFLEAFQILAATRKIVRKITTFRC